MKRKRKSSSASLLRGFIITQTNFSSCGINQISKNVFATLNVVWNAAKTTGSFTFIFALTAPIAGL